MSNVEVEKLVEEIRELVQESRWREIRELLVNLPAPDIADTLLELDMPKRLLLFRLLPRDVSLEVFSHVEPGEKDRLMTALTDVEARYLLENLSPDDRTSFLEDLPGQMIQRMTNLLSPGELRETMQLLGYPDESVGRIMTPDYVAVRSHWSIGQALEHIRRIGKDTETINMIYVTDANWKLLDELDLRKFILASPEKDVESLMDYTVTSVHVEEDQEVAVQLTKRYDLYALPVVDKAGILLGIVTVDDIMDVYEEETTEDIQMTAAVEPLKTGYRETSIYSLFRKRIVWLVTLVFVSMISSGIIAAYEEMLASVIALAFFIPLLNAGGGNAGAQSATLVIRAQATGDVDPGHWLGVAFKELRVGLLLGLCMGLITYGAGVFIGGPDVGLVVGLSMFLIVAVINVIGVVLPFMLVWIGLDPAMASSPLITSVADAVGLLIYFLLAGVFLQVL